MTRTERERTLTYKKCFLIPEDYNYICIVIYMYTYMILWLKKRHKLLHCNEHHACNPDTWTNGSFLPVILLKYCASAFFFPLNVKVIYPVSVCSG